MKEPRSVGGGALLISPMTTGLKITIGQYSDKGRKAINQDFHGVAIPKEPQLSTKGIAIALADGISSSDVGHLASQTAVTGFLEDYFCTSEAWSVKKSVQRVLLAANSWLHAQTRQSQHRYDYDKGYVCTFSAMVIKSTTAHLFHVGDTRIYRALGDSLEQLTQDHRIRVSGEQSYLGRALGINPHLEIDYQTLHVEKGDVFLFATDGVYEHTDAGFMIKCLKENCDDLDNAARKIVNEAYRQGSADNLTVQLVRVDELPNPQSHEIFQQLSDLPFPPILGPRTVFDGHRILRELHASSRSHIYLAAESETNHPIVIKIPSIDLRGDPAYLERFLMEDWIARRLNSAHVLRPSALDNKRNYLYVVTEFIEGQTLAQWMIDNPKPALETVRGIAKQIAAGLRAFHRMEMLHQDLKPGNIMIDDAGTVKIIDFGSVSVAGILESEAATERHHLLGDAPYTAPEYFLGERGTARSDIFSLGVIAYQMLSGRLPYGAEVPKTRTKSAQRNLKYISLLNHDRNVPVWIDEAIRKAVHPSPAQRHEDVSEFIYDLHHPNQAFLNKTRPPLMERDPVKFWRGVSIVLAVIIVILLSLNSLTK